MLRSILCVLPLALAASMTSCATSPSSAATIRVEHDTSRAYVQAYNVPSHGVALEGYCPVAYFAVNAPVRGSADFASTHDDITYYLVSADAKAAFDADPEKYIPAYGGWCAFGMAIEDKFPIDPTNFEIVDGRLMLFLRNPGIDARELWNDGNVAELTAKADSHWRTVQG